MYDGPKLIQKYSNECVITNAEVSGIVESKGEENTGTISPRSVIT